MTLTLLMDGAELHSDGISNTVEFLIPTVKLENDKLVISEAEMTQQTF